MYMPKSVLPLPYLICDSLPPECRSYYEDLVNLGWRFYVVDQKCGRCYFADKIITIPAWLWKESIDANVMMHGLIPSVDARKRYRIWYICHEMAHAFGWIFHKADDHGPLFMQTLKEICPTDSVCFETGYKPKNAIAAGIMPADF